MPYDDDETLLRDLGDAVADSRAVTERARAPRPGPPSRGARSTRSCSSSTMTPRAPACWSAARSPRGSWASAGAR